MNDDMLCKLNELNPDISILPVTDTSFLKYGRVHTKFAVDGLMDYLEAHAHVADEIVYEADAIGATRCAEELKPIIKEVYGGMDDLEVGWVYGRNTNKKLNALEYHKGAEIVITGADMVVLMGHINDIVWPEGTYDTSKAQAYYVPKGTVYEIAPHCLHYAPIHVHEEEGFKCVVILPKGTNTAIDFEPGNEGEDKLLLGKNKWLIAHPEDTSFEGTRAHRGLTGENITINT
jgi:hypothetical protein